MFNYLFFIIFLPNKDSKQNTHQMYIIAPPKTQMFIMLSKIQFLSSDVISRPIDSLFHLRIYHLLFTFPVNFQLGGIKWQPVVIELLLNTITLTSVNLAGLWLIFQKMIYYFSSDGIFEDNGGIWLNSETFRHNCNWLFRYWI